MATTAFADTFHQLKSILSHYEQTNRLVTNDSENYQLYSHKKDKKDRDIYFGGVQIKKNYVSYHLMPVYVFPDLLNDISSALRRRMQGKSCFNFTKTDEQLFAELAQLTQACQDRFEAMDTPPY